MLPALKRRAPGGKTDDLSCYDGYLHTMNMPDALRRKTISDGIDTMVLSETGHDMPPPGNGRRASSDTAI
ncbi:hypothetical protein B9H00_12930 [Kushneria marisflavi]|uniref:Uncharacterized protein n=1 Tax=Kushneria marisflavi TaxID=157779 RepID=A0A240UQT2_9GAMM|nr:hypothetical protein B9H00_12930 [Kushneria marisflavi]